MSRDRLFLPLADGLFSRPRLGTVTTADDAGSAVPPSAAPEGEGHVGHLGVAAWVVKNKADVIGYWPLNDPVASGVVHAGYGQENGTYGSGITGSQVDNQDLTNFDNAAADDSEIPDYAALDNIVAGFCVIEGDTFGGTNEQFVDRDDADGGSRQFQFKYQGSTGKLRFTKIGGTGGNQSVDGTTALQTGQRYTVGFAIYGGNCHLYVNGVDDASGACNALPASSSSVQFGHRIDSITPDRYNGALGSVVLLDSADATTIPALHDAWVKGESTPAGREGVETWCYANPAESTISSLASR